MSGPRTFTVAPPAPGAGEVGRIPLPFDARAAWGRVRMPVLVEVNGHRFASTVMVMASAQFVPFRRSARDAARVADDAAFTVTLTPDLMPRPVAPPDDLAAALLAAGTAASWDRLSPSHRREHVTAIEAARTPQTRARRIARCVVMVGRTN